ncbi:MAG: pitrilysin family protein [Rikenellaceae bacterium]
MPPIVTSYDLTMPPIHKIVTPNKVPLHVLSDDLVSGTVRLSLVFDAGTTLQKVPFSASSMLGMLSQGSKNMDAEQIAEYIDFHGSSFEINIDRDFAVVTICGLSKFFAESINILGEMLLSPVFPEEKLEILKTNRKQRLAVDRSKAGYISRECFARTLFGENHPYGYSSPIDMYDSLCREDILDFYNSHYKADKCFALMGGSVTPELMALAIDLLSKLPVLGEAEKLLCKPSVVPAPISSPFAYIPYEGVQSAVRVGRVLFTRSHPDFIPMQVLSTVLGGYFGSRLIANLRVKNGYTYGIFATMVNLQHTGYLAIATEVGAQFTEAAIEEIFNEMARLRDELVTEEELDMVKNVMIGELMRIMDGSFGVIDIALESIQNDEQGDYVRRFCEQVAAVTPERLQQLARYYLRAEDMTVTVVGPEEIAIPAALGGQPQAL